MAEFTFNPDPPPEVRDYFAAKDLQPAFDWRDVWGEEHAHAFTVAKATELDVLTGIRDGLQRAIDKGVPFEAFKKDLKPLLQKQGWWGVQERTDPKTGEVRDVQLGSSRRLRTIYETNMRTARSAGQWDRAQRTKRALPYFIYTIGPSEVHRPEHVIKEGVIRPVDDPFWTVWMGPNGWGCKCGVRQISAAEAERRGGVSDAPRIVTKKYRNDRTGETVDVPLGIDPGFDNNPGLARAENLSRFLAGKLERAPAGMARRAVTDLVRQPEFRRHARGEREGFLPIAVMSDDLAEAMGVQTRLLRFSQDTARKQAERHPDLEAEDYASLQRGLEQAEVWRDGERLVLFVEGGERAFRAVVKPTRDRSELYLTTLHRARPRQRRNAEKRFERLR